MFACLTVRSYWALISSLNSPPAVEAEGSLPRSQKPVADLCLELRISNPHHYNFILLRRLLSCYFPSDYTTGIYYSFLAPAVHSTCTGHLVILGESYNYETSDCTVVAILVSVSQC